ncbi:MAG: ABC transporter permease, partial [bacterium]
MKHSIKTALEGLKVHKSRSLLTILGIVIGIAAIILVVSIGEGAQQLILSQVESLGSRTIAVVPGREPEGPTDPAVVEALFSDSLKTRELEALKKKSNVPKLEEIMPVVFGVETASFEGETFRPMVMGASELITRIFNIFPEEGAFFTEDDIRGRAAVAVIGTEVKDELFGPSDAIGEKIRVKGVNLRVIGVLPPKGQVLFFNFDEIVLVPYTTAQQYIFGIKHFNRFIIQAETKEDVQRTVSDIEATLRSLHGITDPEKDDFFVGTQEEAADTFETVTNVLTLFLASVAAISLLVGGVGIMNVTLVSVTERTREIGLRKALGATERNILLQFLFEAVALTAAGGVFGVLLGAVLSFAASLALTHIAGLAWSFVFPAVAAVIGIAVAAAVGLVFGLYPAYRASKKSPLEALR